jgi:large subunit ribosomal protein L24e
MAECSFCGEKLSPGTGFLFVKKDGTPFFFCSRKCEHNMLFLKRKPIGTKWAGAFRQAKQAGIAGTATSKKEIVVEKKKEEPVKAKKKKARRKKKR